MFLYVIGFKGLQNGLMNNENFRAITKIGKIYTKFVDVFHQIDENELDWKHELKKLINARETRYLK